MPVPDAWAGEISGKTVEVLPLVKDPAAHHPPGWCSYVYRHAESPELEVFCGGINEKTVQAAAVWRQGNLLHFGFEPSPAELNDAGRALLINCVAYIARFAEDRPITEVTSPFVGPAPPDRAAVLRALARSDDLAYLKYIASDATYKDLETRTPDERQAWYRQFEGYLHGDANGKLAIDQEAAAFGVPPNTAEFLDKAIAALEAGDDAAGAARRLLGRYAPLGPVAEGPVGKDSSVAWNSWWRANKPYLFFSDSGGYRCTSTRWPSSARCRRPNCAAPRVPTNPKPPTGHVSEMQAMMRSWQPWSSPLACLICLVGCVRPATTTAVGKQAADKQTQAPVEAETAQTPSEEVEVSEPAPSNPVAAAAAILPATFKAPVTATLVIRVRTAPGWHIYAVDHPTGTAQPTRLELKLPDGVEPEGEWLNPEASLSAGAGKGQFIYEGDFTFRRRLKISEQVEPGRVEIGCQINYQACDPFLCRPPESLTVRAAAEVVQKPGGR
jgi:DsbC/DsbD-like thiol-disulfide interchange protein